MISRTEIVINPSKPTFLMHIVKRAGRVEKFSARKIHKSCYVACLEAKHTQLEAKRIAAKIQAATVRWAGKRGIVSTEHIFRFIASALRRQSRNAALRYETFHDY